VANFGAGILAAPPHKGFDLLAWWLPLGGLAAGALLLGFGVWRWSRARTPEDRPLPVDEETERRLDELLARLD
jgi:cytochrome c-type biogenesis protein CcmH/NrfF